MYIIDLINENYNSFNAPRRRIADFILKDPVKCSFLSLKELSLQASASEVTILSFCKDLGLSSYVELKVKLKEYILDNKAPEERFKHYASSGSDIKHVYEETIKNISSSSEETFRQNTYEKITGALAMLKKAKKIYIAAHGASRVAATYFQLRFRQLGSDVELLDSESEIQNIIILKNAEPAKSLLLSIATPPYGKTTLALTTLAKSLGLPVLSMTDSTSSPLIELSTLSLVCVTAENFKGIINSYSSFFSVVEVLNLLFFAGEEKQESDESFLKLMEQYKALT